MRSLAVVIAMVMVVCLASTAEAILWVATTGNDATGTGTQASPYATIQKAVHVANAGTENTIYVTPGTYAGFINETAAQGNPAKRVYVYSYNPATSTVGDNWKNTIINSPSASVDPNQLNTFVTGRGWENTKTYTLGGFTLQGSGPANSETGVRPHYGGSIYSESEFARVENCVITGFSTGAFVNYNGMKIYNSLIYGNNYGVYTAATTNTYGKNEGFNLTITANNVGVYTTYVGLNLYNSIAHGNTTRDYEIYHGTGPAQFTIANTDLGVFYANWNPGTAWAVNNLNVNPGFAGGTGADQYMLGAGSPLINQGSTSYSSLAFDLWGNPRIIGSSIDMGAHEAALPIPEPATAGLVIISMIGLAIRRR